MPNITTFEQYRDYAIQTAYELCYPESVRDRLRRATSEEECTLIMCTARNRY